MAERRADAANDPAYRVDYDIETSERLFLEGGGESIAARQQGEKVGTAYVEHNGPISRWGWFSYVNGDTASNGFPLETSEQAYEDLEETMKRHGLSVKQPTHGN
jgi:hypothetical protein